ncbi:murein biosynthesis integral membrane protein MurJ [Tepidibacter formicigenes]|jgi:putative peptidoglycan lipid II flippase|uniref:Probable lipid II flippase MurJ n=1 Tax=Tepidibacter formicigenes DSM 15518 TaxID=1123349 RepID=A0A1M6PBP7_9FIRM|nr:murein biosynthesis integral membrane protein MurJ [Tepidibacter formicigenes]SHK05375.1 putative peptidoglycan lipid II flippase [Tepidibacter formicigenes DSM 15518]
MSNQKKTTKAVALVMIIMILSRLLGFVREVIMTNKFGRGMETDAFFAAFTIPDVMYYLLVGGALSSAFIPVFTSYLSKGDEEEAWKVASTFINVSIILLLVLSVLGMIFADYLVPLVAYNFKGEQLSLTVELTRFMFPAVTFTALAGLETGVLNSYKIFNAPSIGPILYNVGIILGTIFLSSKFGIKGMAIGVVFGAVSNFLFQFIFVAKKAKNYKFTLDLKHPGVRKIFKLILPALIGLSVTQINLVVNQNIASGFDEGSITALRLANRIMQLPLGIFSVSIATVIFPTITSQIAKGEIKEFRETFSMGMRNIFFVTIPSAIGLMTIGVSLIRLLFVRGAFKENDAQITASILIFYTLGLAFQGGVQLLTRGFYANQDTKTPVKISFIAVLGNILLSLFLGLATPMRVKGLALAYSITSFINMSMLFNTLRKKMGGISGKEIVVSSLKTTFASIIMGISIVILNLIFSKYFNIHNKQIQFIQVSIGVLLGAGVFLFTANILKMQEVRDITMILRRKKAGN